MGKLSSPCIIKDQLLSHECDLSLLYTSAQIYHVSLSTFNNLTKYSSLRKESLFFTYILQNKIEIIFNY